MPPRIPTRTRVIATVLLAASLGAWLGAQTPAEKKAPATPQTRSSDYQGGGSGELVLHKWSGAINVPDPVAVSVDPQGRVYVSATTRRKVADLDIREHTVWIPDDVALTSVEEKRAFLQRELAPGKLRAPRGELRDHNGDGSIDVKDLTFHSERIYQLRDTDGDGTADKMTVFAEGFNTEVTGIAAGVMYHDGWVYATIVPDLWRFKDTDDDGVADIREVVVHGFGHHLGYAGHDMHGLMVGPDGRIYWSIGDKGLNVVSKEGRRYFFPNTGATLRVEPDGTGFEVYTYGNRNIQEPAFNAYGDLIGVDNDADQPGERERFVHIPEASDSGWRCTYQYMRLDSPWMREGLWKPHFAGQAAYLLPARSNYSDGPAGFKFNPGTALGEKQHGMFLLNEFPSGKMRGFRVEPEGATYRMVDARIVNDGIMGIGLSWAADGSLFMADWIGGYPLDGIGAVWRVDAKTAAINPARVETGKILKAGFGARDNAELVKLLAHEDQRVRQGAQFELARRNQAGALRDVALNPSAAQFARIHAVWGYGQLLRRNAAGSADVAVLLRDADAEIRAQTAKIFGDAATSGAKAEGRALVALLSDASPRVRLQAGIALGKYREASAVDALRGLAGRDGADPVLRHAAVAGLTGCATAAQLAAMKADPSVNVRLVAVVALRRQQAAEVAQFLTDADPLVVAEAARAIHDDQGIADALPALAAQLERQPADEVIARRAINAGLRAGTTADAARLLRYALDESAPRAMRLEALTTLRVWTNPPRLDRVDGWARTCKPATVDAVLAPQLDRLLALNDAELKSLAIEIMIAHRLKAGAAQIAAIVAETGASADLRAQAMRLLAGNASNDPALVRTLDLALASDAPAPLHRVAMELLLPGQPARLVTEAKTTLQSRSTAEKQQALALLAQAATPDADAVIATYADALGAGRCEPALQLDVIEALRARGATNPALAAALKNYESSNAAGARLELLTGGDPARGREVVTTHLGANCSACHTIESGSGSEVGPNLRSIGAQRDPAYLLESLLTPSAKIATGYGLVAVTLKNHQEYTGTLAKETPEAVTVRLFDGKQQVIPRTEIATQSAPISIMPPMGAILQPREIRDVVAYLSNLKGGGGRGPRGARPASK